jgi:4-diphosphocytidyl-2C-methyl-D-erythritol kinase
LYQEFLRQGGAPVALMSGSGSTTFALLPRRDQAEELAGRLRHQFGESCWTAVVPV